MIVDELIVELQRLSKEGLGGRKVYTNDADDGYVEVTVTDNLDLTYRGSIEGVVIS